MRATWVALLAVVLATLVVLTWRMWFEDAVLVVDPARLAQLEALRREPKFMDLPGLRVEAERQRNTANLDELLGRVASGIEQHPSKRWLFSEMAPTVSRMALEDTEARERFLDYLQRLDRIFGIESTHGAFATDLIFF